MKIISTILYTIFIALIVGIAGLLLGSMLKVPGNIEVKIVKSGSMEPAIPTGSIVVVKPKGSYAIGDVITFGKDTKTDVPTTHRIIAHNNDGTYTVKGDANEEADPNPVERTTIIGKVVFHVPYVGYLLNFARQPIGFTLLIAIPAGLVILEEILAIVRETRKWLKRKRGGDGGGSGDPQSDPKNHLLHIRKRSMDEIFVPMRLHFAKRAISPRTYVQELLSGDAYGTSTVLVLCLVFTSASFAGISGGTISYFQDIETSINNILQAGTWTPPPILTDDGPQISLFSLADASTTGEVLGASDEAPPDDATSTDEGTTTPESPGEASDSGATEEGTSTPSDDLPADPPVEDTQAPPVEDSSPQNPDQAPNIDTPQVM